MVRKLLRDCHSSKPESPRVRRTHARTLLDVLAILIQCRGTDEAQFSSRKHGLQEVGCIHTTLLAAHNMTSQHSAERAESISE
jgi:hypothetical protein